MKITNNSVKVIGVGEKIMMPGESIVIAAKDFNEPLKALQELGVLSVEKDAVAETAPVVEEVAEETEKVAEKAVSEAPAAKRTSSRAKKEA